MRAASMEGKVALVMGGTAGIGRAAAELLARAGARVAITGRSQERGRRAEQELQGLGGEVVYVPADVSEPEQVEASVRFVAERFGRLDYACNNAAALGRMARTAEFSEEEFDREVRTNLRSVWLSMKAELEQMERQGGAGCSIVNTSSVNGLGGVRGGALYAMAKAGILALTKSAAQEYAEAGIRVNALVAGAFDTEMLRSALSQRVGSEEAAVEAGLSMFAAQIPMRRIGRPEEAAKAVLWLLGEESSYVTGASMIVDGGLTAWAR